MKTSIWRSVIFGLNKSDNRIWNNMNSIHAFPAANRTVPIRLIFHPSIPTGWVNNKLTTTCS